MRSKQIEEAIALNPSAMGPRVSLGALLLREGNVAAAEVTFKRALAAAPQSLDAHLALGQYLLGHPPLQRGRAHTPRG